MALDISSSATNATVTEINLNKAINLAKKERENIDSAIESLNKKTEEAKVKFEGILNDFSKSLSKDLSSYESSIKSLSDLQANLKAEINSTQKDIDQAQKYLKQGNIFSGLVAGFLASFVIGAFIISYQAKLFYDANKRVEVLVKNSNVVIKETHQMISKFETKNQTLWNRNQYLNGFVYNFLSTKAGADNVRGLLDEYNRAGGAKNDIYYIYWVL